MLFHIFVKAVQIFRQIRSSITTSPFAFGDSQQSNDMHLISGVDNSEMSEGIYRTISALSNLTFVFIFSVGAFPCDKCLPNSCNMTPQLVVNPLTIIMWIKIIGSHTFFVIMNVANKSVFYGPQGNEIKSFSNVYLRTRPKMTVCKLLNILKQLSHLNKTNFAKTSYQQKTLNPKP